MTSDSRIVKHYVPSKVYRDLKKPTILTNGELGIYYLNTENLAMDNGEFEKYGDNSQAMIAHAVRMTEQHPSFKEVIDVLVEDAKRLVKFPSANYAIAGGQRRDWLFSGPVAHQLGMIHISLYKNGVIEGVTSHGDRVSASSFSAQIDPHALVISDLITEGSSAYTSEGGVERGWIPMLRKSLVKVDDLIAVTDRLQGGKERLAKIHVTLYSKVEVDTDFLREVSSQPEEAISYLQNPTQWSQNYLAQNGALDFVPDFDPQGKRLDRAKNF